MENFEAFNRQKACRHGQMLYNIHDVRVGRSLDLYGEYAEGEVELLRQVVPAGAPVVEVGAHIGAHTVFLARQVTPTGVVVAFEPQRILHQTLCANLALNNLSNVFCFQQALGARRASVFTPQHDYTRDADFGRVSLDKQSGGEQVPLVRLDDFKLQACHLLKIDVEGMERDVIEGAADLIRRCKPILYVENSKPDKADALVRHIASLSYKMYWHRPLYFSPQNFFGNFQNVFANTVALKMVCIHETIGQDLQGLEPVSVPPEGNGAP